MEELVDIVTFIHQEISEAFGDNGTEISLALFLFCMLKIQDRLSIRSRTSFNSCMIFWVPNNLTLLVFLWVHEHEHFLSFIVML